MEATYDGPSVYPFAIVLAVTSFLTIPLDIPPLIWHAKRKNIGVISLIAWTIFLNLVDFVNAVIWPNDNLSQLFSGHVFCDVQVKLLVGSFIGLSSALAAIMRNLANVLNIEDRPVVPSAAQQKRERLVEAAICWVPPIVLMLLHYIVQPSRYYIFGISGCTPSLDNSWLSVALIFIWEPIFALLDAYYALLVVIRIHRYRRQFSQILTASNTSKTRFLRLLVMSEIMVICFTPLQFYVFYTNIAVSHHPFSWAAVHPPNWSQRIIRVPSGGLVLYDRWFRVGCGILVFLFFGMSSDALELYKTWMTRVGCRGLWCTPQTARRAQEKRVSRISRATDSFKGLFHPSKTDTSSICSTTLSSVVTVQGGSQPPLSATNIDKDWASNTISTINSVVQ